MPQTERFASIQELSAWLEKQNHIGILESGDGYFIVQCPNDAAL
ncbi:MAG: hypothetical protein Pg6C_05430 [Treponemataceae bacterium]|nr:MAG: hypothetical protein Pg6C_05430 [Treponemataceae bacterium]